MVIIQLAKPHGAARFAVTLVDIAKGMGKSNPYDRKVQLPIWQVIDDLLETDVRIRPDTKLGCTGKFSFVEGYVDRDGRGELGVGRFLDIIRDLALGCTSIRLQNYFSIKSRIGRSLHVFLESQQKFYRNEGYETSLMKLCRNLNYDRAGRPWSQVWRHVAGAVEELVALELVGQYRRDRTRHPRDGGVIAFWPARKEKERALPETTTDTDLFDAAMALVDSGLLNSTTRTTLRRNLDDLVAYNRLFVAVNAGRAGGGVQDLRQTPCSGAVSACARESARTHPRPGSRAHDLCRANRCRAAARGVPRAVHSCSAGPG